MLKVRFAAAFVLALGVLHGQDNQVITLSAPPASSAPAIRGLLWKVTSATNTVYLAGAPRTGSEDMYPLAQEMEDAFRQSSVLFVECDPREDKVKKTVSDLVATAGTYPPGDLLWNHVSERTRALLPGFAAEHGLNVETLSKMKPWAAALILSPLSDQAAGMRIELGIDMHFLDEVTGVQRIHELETADQQIRALMDVPEREYAQILEESVTEPERSKQGLARMKAAWMEGDLAAYEALVSEKYATLPGAQKHQVDDRGERLAAAVEGCLKSRERCFVAVRPGFLVGQEGIVARLAAKGFRVERIAPASYREALPQPRDLTLPSGKRIHIASMVRMHFERGPDALVLNCLTDVSVDDMVALRSVVDEIWSIFRIDVEKAGMKSGAIRIAHPEGGGPERGYGFVFNKRADGQWHCLEDERK